MPKRGLDPGAGSQRTSDWFRSLGSERGTALHIRAGSKYGARCFRSNGRTRTIAVVEVSSRIATRDRAVDFDKPGPAFRCRRRSTNFIPKAPIIPVDGIVKETSDKIVAEEGRTDIDKARAIYEWIVDNTLRDPKVRGCGVGDIRPC